jgi:hypothetical protein
MDNQFLAEETALANSCDCLDAAVSNLDCCLGNRSGELGHDKQSTYHTHVLRLQAVANRCLDSRRLQSTDHGYRKKRGETITFNLLVGVTTDQVSAWSHEAIDARYILALLQQSPPQADPCFLRRPLMDERRSGCSRR